MSKAKNQAPSADDQPQADAPVLPPAKPEQVEDGAASTKPYGADNPAPGAAGYDAPELDPKPGTPEWLVANPGAITSGSVDPRA